MKLRPLEYVAITHNRLPWWLPTGVGIALAVILLATVPIRWVQLRVDPMTGSISRQTFWPLGITSGPTVVPSALAIRLKHRPLPERDVAIPLRSAIQRLGTGYGCRLRHGPAHLPAPAGSPGIRRRIDG
jgi:hypothetical protein